MSNRHPYLNVWFGFDEATETSSAVATTGRLQAAIMLGLPRDLIAMERREPPETMCLENPGVVFVETAPYSRAYEARNPEAQRGVA